MEKIDVVCPNRAFKYEFLGSMGHNLLHSCPVHLSLCKVNDQLIDLCGMLLQSNPTG